MFFMCGKLVSGLKLVLVVIGLLMWMCLMCLIMVVLNVVSMVCGMNMWVLLV